MRILITGASGFIGSYVLNLCLKKGHYIIAHKRRGSIDKIAVQHNYHWISMDLMDINVDHLAGVKCIIHLAATGVSPRSASWDELQRINIMGTLHMSQLAKQIGARIVVAGTFAEYGLNGARFDRIPPTAALEPTFPYAASKAAGYQLSSGFARCENLELAYLRVFNAYGTGQHKSNLWPSLRTAALNGENFKMSPGEQVRDFVAIESVSKGFYKAATELKIEQGKPLVANLGSGKPTTVANFCKHWWDYYKAEGSLLIGALEYRDNEIMRFVPEINRHIVGEEG